MAEVPMVRRLRKSVHGDLRRLYRIAAFRASRDMAEFRLRHFRPQRSMFHAKVQYKMQHDRDPMLAVYADKLKVRDYVEGRIGSQYLTRLYAVVEDPATEDLTRLPGEFVLKANHSFGAAVIVWTGAPQGNTLEVRPEPSWGESFLVRPENFDPDIAARLMAVWLEQNYGWIPGTLPEWAYQHIPPRIVVEELLLDRSGGLPVDYKFFMFNGECGLVQVDLHRFSGHRRNLYDASWNPLPCRFGYPNSQPPPARPERLDEMLQIAGELSSGIDFIRVDLYQTHRGVKFGELTNYPEGGLMKFSPRSWNYVIGKDWIPNYG